MNNAEPRSPTRDPRRLVAAAIIVAACAACGKKGPPLAPLNLVPDKPAGITARVVDDTVYIHTFVPSKNANGPGAPVVDRVELYAVTLDKGAMAPPNRDLFLPSRVIARIEVKPPVDPDAAVDESAPRDTRPGAGDAVNFTEPLAAAQRVPEIKAVAAAAKPAGDHANTATNTAMETPTVETPGSPDAVPAGGAASATGGTAGLPGGDATGISAAFLLQLPDAGPLTAPGTQTPLGATAPVPPAALMTVPTRLYVVRGVTKRGRGGTPSPRVLVDLEPPPPPAPTSPAAAFTESAITITWKAPADATTLKYNVYDAEQPAGATAAPAPLNAAPLDTMTFDRTGADAGVERCFVVRSVQTRESVDFESAPSPRACVTPRDIFPPAPPKALAAVAGAGAVNLIWDANDEPDLAGYLVLRGEVPGDTLQPLMTEPIRETLYLDTTAKPGVQYVYVVVAVDKAGNRSGNSNRVTETAR